MRRAALLFGLLPAIAAAQPAAEREPERYPPSGLGGDVAFGLAGQRGGPSGWVARLEYEAFPVFAPDGIVGGVVGFQPGLELWRSSANNWGFSLPVGIVLGVRVFPVRVLAGVGFDTFLIDQVADTTGVGFFAPFAMARFAIDVHGFEAGVDARLGYRWQIGADDHTRWQLGFFVGKTFGSKPPHGPFF